MKLNPYFLPTIILLAFFSFPTILLFAASLQSVASSGDFNIGNATVQYLSLPFFIPSIAAIIFLLWNQRIGVIIAAPTMILFSIYLWVMFSSFEFTFVTRMDIFNALILTTPAFTNLVLVYGWKKLEKVKSKNKWFRFFMALCIVAVSILLILSLSLGTDRYGQPPIIDTLTITGYDMREYTNDEPLRLHDHTHVLTESVQHEILDSKKTNGEWGAIYIENVGTGPVEIKQVKWRANVENYLETNYSIYHIQESGIMKMDNSDEILPGELATIVVEFAEENSVGRDVVLSIETQKDSLFQFQMTVGNRE